MTTEVALAEQPAAAHRVPAGSFVHRTVATVDGETLAARLFEPTGSPKAAALIVPAMAVPQHYYAQFASWLAAQGVLTLTFDYRGIGLSRTRSLRNTRADVFDWAELDCAAMADLLAASARGAPFYWIGHSLGGQIFPLVPNNRHVSKIITVATGSGYWRENSRPARYMTGLLWHTLAPAAVRLCGYFPGKRLGIVGDLPAGVITQWRRWCLHPEYLVGAEGERVRELFAAVRTPIVSLSFTDDEYMSSRNTESMHGFYSNAPRTMKRFSPAELGVRRIGHFGFFRPSFRENLWEAHLRPALELPA